MLAAAPWGLLRSQTRRPRFREAVGPVGRLATGPRNAITDVPGVRVGHTTVVDAAANIQTGVTAILPHGGNLFREKVPGAVYVFNAFGKLAGSTQVVELGEIESPLMLTSTLNVPRVADAVLDYLLALPGNEEVRSANPLVGETNDGLLNDIRRRAVTREHVLAAIRGASDSNVEEGAVGAGAGTVCFGWKGGIGTSSRRVGEHTVGVLVQTNFGGELRILGAPVGERLRAGAPNTGDGSVMIIVATDMPLEAHSLRRLAARPVLALGRVGSNGSHGSGDYVIAFSTRRGLPESAADVSRLFPAVIDATEEAIYNSLFRAETTKSNGRTLEALPLDKVLPILRQGK
ncbi:MAG: P1 family peptidase [Bryobacteraceae bacterium]|nr:P1 family peptidase [Bryobacteraceae bacterium]